MKLSLCITCLLFSAFSFAQVNTPDIILLHQLIRNIKPEGEIVYTDKLNEDDIKSICSKIKKEFFTTKIDSTRKNTLSISRQERKLIESHLELYSYPYWQPDLFTGSKMIAEQNVLSYYKTVYQKYSEAYTDPNNSQLEKNNILKNTPQPYIFEFSRPLFLRDSSYCFVVLKSICGNNCGSSEAVFYKKNNSQWERFVSLSLN